MAREYFNLGTGSNTGDGDGLRTAFQKVDNNFTDAYTHANSTNNPHNVTAAQVGAIPTTQLGVAAGVATLDGSGVLKSTQRPAYNLGQITQGDLQFSLTPSASYDLGSTQKVWNNLYVSNIAALSFSANSSMVGIANVGLSLTTAGPSTLLSVDGSPVLVKVTANGAIVLASQQALILGAGASPQTFVANADPTVVSTVVTSDNHFEVFTNLGQGWANRRYMAFDANATLVVDAITLRPWATGSDIDNLLPNIDLGSILEGPDGGSMVVGIQSDDIQDGFYIVDKGIGGTTYSNLLLAVSPSTFSYSGNTILHAGNYADYTISPSGGTIAGDLSLDGLTANSATIANGLSAGTLTVNYLIANTIAVDGTGLALPQGSSDAPTVQFSGTLVGLFATSNALGLTGGLALHSSQGPAQISATTGLGITAASGQSVVLGNQNGSSVSIDDSGMTVEGLLTANSAILQTVSVVVQGDPTAFQAVSNLGEASLAFSSDNPILSLTPSTGGSAFRINYPTGNTSVELAQNYTGSPALISNASLQIVIDASNSGQGAFAIAKGSWGGRVGVDGTALLTLNNDGSVVLASPNITAGGYTVLHSNNFSGVADTRYLQLGGGVLSGPLTLAGDPTQGLQAATKQYVDSVAQGLTAKDSAHVAAATNITLSGTQTVDGVALNVGDRVLVMGQTIPSQNGIYVVAAGAWSRSLDMDVWSEVPGAFVFIVTGTQYGNTGWVCTSPTAGTLDSTAVIWVQFSGAGAYSGANGIALAGSTFGLTGKPLSLYGLASTGLISALSNNTVRTISLQAPAKGLTITNPDGVAGNPTFALADELAALQGLTTTGYAKRTGTAAWVAQAIPDGDLPIVMSGKTFTSPVTIQNAIVLANASIAPSGDGNAVQIGGPSGGGLIPAQASMDLGTVSRAWRTLYANSVSVNGVATALQVISTNTIGTGQDIQFTRNDGTSPALIVQNDTRLRLVVNAANTAQTIYLGIDPSNNLTVGNHVVWTSQNMGPGSGLNADILDGQTGAYYLNASNVNAGVISDTYLPSVMSGKTFSGNVLLSNPSAVLGVGVTAPQVSLEANGPIRADGAVATQYLEISGGDANGIYLIANSNVGGEKPLTIINQVSGGNSVTATQIVFQVQNTKSVVIANTGDLVFWADNTFNIGGLAARPRDVNVANAVQAPTLYANSIVATTQAVLQNATLGAMTVDGAATFLSTVMLAGDPTQNLQAATKQYVDNAVQGLSAKQSVRAATTGDDITLAGIQVIDGVALNVGDRVLVKDQADSTQNGLYIVITDVWVRSLDTSVWGELPGAFVFVEQGAVNRATGWVCTNQPGGILGTTPVTWVQFSAQGAYTGSNGVVVSAQTIQLTGQALALQNYSTPGLVGYRFGAFTSAALVAPAQGLTITNPDGVAGNPTFALADELAAIQGLATTGYTKRTGTATWVAQAIPDSDLPSTLTGKTFTGQITSTVPTGTAPMVVASTTQVNNLNAELLAGQPASYYTNASSISSGTISSAYLPANVNALTLNGQLASYYTNASSISAGTIQDAYLPTSLQNKSSIRFTNSNDAGIGFWNNGPDTYGINMSVYGDVTYGGRLDPTSDTNIYYRINGGGSNRGHVFVSNNNLVAQIAGTGQLYLAAQSAGTPPFVLSANATGMVTYLNAQYLNGQSGPFYQNASSLNAGTINPALLPTTITQPTTFLANISANASVLFANGSATAPSMAFSGDTSQGFYRSGTTLTYARGGTNRFFFTDTDFCSATFGFGASIRNLQGSSTIPTILPAVNFKSVGLGTSTDKQFSLIANSIEIARVNETGFSVQHGALSHNGLTPTQGTNIDQVYAVTDSLVLSTSWQNTTIEASTLATGTYIVQVYVSDVASGGTENAEYYSGLMSWYAGATNETSFDEITLHRAGVSTGGNAIYLQVPRTLTGDPNQLVLQIASTNNDTSASNVQFSFRRMI